MLTQNAIYYKVKKVVAFNSTGALNVLRLGINFNGRESLTPNDVRYNALWTQQGMGNPSALDMGDLPVIGQQYDANRLAGVALKWFPGIPNGSMTGAYVPMTVTYDRDGIEGNVLTSTIASQLEQVNSVKVKNMYRPWKMYIKAPKYKINTRIPSNTVLSDNPSAADGYEPNENLAGQWKRVANQLSATFDLQSGDYIYIPRGSHLLVHVETPAALTEGGIIGTMVITSYYVYKDRR